MGTRIVIDEEKCILAGECIYNHPDYFAWDEDETAALVVKADIEGDDDQRHADQAISLCPGGAISIVGEAAED